MVRAEDRDRLTGGAIRWGTETRKIAIHSSLTTNKTSDQRPLELLHQFSGVIPPFLAQFAI